MKANAGTTVKLPTVRLIKAAVLTIRVNDPQHLLPVDSKLVRPLVMGVFNESDTFYPAEQASVDENGRNLQICIPYSRQLQVWIQSWRFKLVDGTGKPVDSKGTRIPLRVERGGAIPEFVFTIVGEIAS